MPEQVKEKNHYIRRFREDYWFRARVNLCCSLVINIIYSLWEIICGIYYNSFWFIAFGAFYLLLTGLRLMLVFNLYNHGLDENQGWREYRISGGLLFIMNFLLVAVVLLVFNGDINTRYANYMLILIGIYAVYRIGASIEKLIAYRKRNTPILSTANMIYFAGAIVTAFSFEISALIRFSNNESFVYPIIAASGALCFILIGAIAEYMILNSGTRHWVKKRFSDYNIGRTEGVVSFDDIKNEWDFVPF
ncbi:MAG: hypothetical protein LUD22_01595 [Coprobacillus sp.]|nr:hypothetical protein [Coprobacillus sp.]